MTTKWNSYLEHRSTFVCAQWSKNCIPVTAWWRDEKAKMYGSNTQSWSICNTWSHTTQRLVTLALLLTHFRLSNLGLLVSCFGVRKIKSCQKPSNNIPESSEKDLQHISDTSENCVRPIRKFRALSALWEVAGTEVTAEKLEEHNTHCFFQTSADR